MRSATLTLPLLAVACLVTPAKATLISSFNNGSCSGAGSTANVAGSCSSSLLPNNPANNLNGLHLIGDLTATSTNSGPGGFGVTFDWSGTANGGLVVGTVPLTWDFIVSEPLVVGSVGAVSCATTTSPGPCGALDFNYTLDYYFNDHTIDVHESGGGTVNGSGVTVLGSDSHTFSGALTDWEVILNVTSPSATPTTGLQMEVQVPAGSIDLNAGVPEPSTLLLFAPALGWLIFRQRRKTA